MNLRRLYFMGFGGGVAFDCLLRDPASGNAQWAVIAMAVATLFDYLLRRDGR